ncbi:alpha/beta-hydrolase [Trichoderma citrinoviride]|uniref:Alpha/beta-hydrolase n=1 Tax=Trichoderma citrinoviride TaxID=58853 RepID=A0A2T4AXD2_9HYPO|nr:alpha/beta-hydrolase [Trichoderma citrinoviride]PTB61740.1 alpha/beta-hydrolase [Trichoderma citrinoviride]
MSEHRRDVSIQTIDGVALKGWFFPAGSEKDPCVIMTHGISALKEHFLDRIAVELQKAGFNVLLYDNRGFGESGGRRYDIDPIKAQDDYVDAFDYAASLPDVDPERIAFWGVSLSGGVAISTAAIDRRVKAVVAVVPFVSGELLMGTGQPILDMAQRDRAKIRKGEAWPLTGIVASTIDEAEAGTAPVVLRDAVSYRFFQDAAAQGGNWENKITTMSLFRILRFEPIRYIHRVAPAPLLMIVGEKDEELLSLQLQAFGLAREPKQLHILKGGNHFNHYQGEISVESIRLQINFLKQCL